MKLCGWDEFGEPSVPPRYYLDKTLGGSVVICDYHSPGGKGPCLDDPCISPIGSKVTAQIVVTGNGADDGARAVTGTIIQMSRIAPGVIRLGVDAAFATAVPGRGTGELRFNSNVFYSQFVNNSNIVFANVTEGDTITFAADVSFFSFGKTDSVVFTACVPVSESIRYLYSGSAKYDPAISCDELATDTRRRFTIDEAYGCEPATSGGLEQITSTAFEPALTFFVEPAPISGKSYQEQQSTGLCVGDKKATFCDRNENLNGEDTDADGIVRLLASPTTGTWSDWQTVGDGTGGTCANPECCRARHEIRTGRIFQYNEAKFRAYVTPLDPGTEVEISIGIYRRSYNVGAYALFQILTFTATADMAGVAQIEGEVPNAEGFETYAGSCTYKVPE